MVVAGRVVGDEDAVDGELLVREFLPFADDELVIPRNVHLDAPGVVPAAVVGVNRDVDAHVVHGARPDGLDVGSHRLLDAAVVLLFETGDSDDEDGLVGFEDELLADRQRLLHGNVRLRGERLAFLRDDDVDFLGLLLLDFRLVDVVALGASHRRLSARFEDFVNRLQIGGTGWADDCHTFRCIAHGAV